MKSLLITLLGAVYISGQARAQQPEPEAQVTAEVTDVVTRIAAGGAPQERFTQRGAAMTLASGTAARQLRGCSAPALRLADRQAKGEERQYLYRLDCGAEVWQLEVDYDRTARISRLELRPSR